MFTGYVNQELWTHDANQLLSTEQVYTQILTTPGIEGVTYSGGEPFEQAAGVRALSRLLKDAGLSIMAYSGHTYQELAAGSDDNISGILATLDILIGGPFEQAQAAPLLWRGSRNQQVRFLTPRYTEYQALIERECIEMEFTVDERELGITGNFDKELLQKIAAKLQQDYGIIVSETSGRRWYE